MAAIDHTLDQKARRGQAMTGQASAVVEVGGSNRWGTPGDNWRKDKR
jgi:hypothetical protein